MTENVKKFLEAVSGNKEVAVKLGVMIKEAVAEVFFCSSLS